MAGPISHMFYADDSGDLDDGWVVYGWLELDVEHWDTVLRYWLTFRKKLVADFGVPTHQELHTTAFVNGRGRISSSPPSRFRHGGDVHWKPLGREVAIRCLEAIRDCPHIEIGAAFKQTPLRGKDINEHREQAYTDLVAIWDEQLRHQDAYGIVGMDGDGSDPIYYAAHRALDLDTRRIIEDPMFHSSRRSQWTQMADIIAWSSYAHLNPQQHNDFAWSWYADYLAARNVMTEPIELP